jgi:alginate O-acetyltransferase complex protein AlgI
MLLAGLWHGAGWTFILWGAWHGAAVCINHAWRRRHSAAVAPATPRLWARATTVLTVVLGWTLFRSPDLETARSFAASLAGLNGITVPVSLTTWVESLAPFVRPRGLFPAITATPTMLIVLVLAVFFAFRGPRLLAFFGVTSRDVVAGESGIGSELAPASSRLAWGRFVVAGLMLALAIATLARTSPFLYYQF